MAASIECVIPVDIHCPACATRMEARMRQIGGITAVRAEHPEGQAVVCYDPDRISIHHARTAVEKVASATEHPHSTLHGRAHRHAETGYLITAGILWLAGIASLLSSMSVQLYKEASLSDGFLLLATAIAGWPVLRGAWSSLQKKKLGVNVLIAIATIGAAALGELFEAASLVVLFGASEWLEHRTSARAQQVAKGLLEEAPDTAVVLRDGEAVVLPVEAVEVGESLLVRPGDRIGLDGTVRAGSSWVDESAITGESTPASKEPGDTVYAGSLNRAGALEVCTSREAKGSTIARIAELVSQATANRPEIQRMVDRFAKIYTPIVVGLAVLTVVVPILFGQPARPWILRALTLLVISCPCAFVISLPATMAAALHAGARNGLVIKGGKFLERAASVDVVCFDKTGTLTTGDLTAETLAAPAGDVSSVLQIAASLEARSEHSIGKAILDQARGIERLPVDTFRALPGRGVKGTIAGETYLLGKPAFFPQAATEAMDLSWAENCSVLLGTQRRILGGFRLLDHVRDESASVVSNLTKLGIQSVMISGDRAVAAEQVATAVGIGEIHSDLLPEDKQRVIEQLGNGEVVCMVGDGINDAPALAAADLGIAMGVSAATTAQAGDVVLSGSGLHGLPKLIRLARRAFRMARWNMIIAFALKALVAGLALFGITSLALAVIVGDVGATLLVTANAVRLSRAQLSS